jgi:hypothetical protein
MVHYPSKWTLANVIQVCLKLDAVKSFLQSNMSAFSITANNLLSGDPQTSLNVFSELQSHLLELIPIAALWRHSFKDQRVFSLKSFCDDSDTAVILGASQQFEKPLMMLNRLVVKRMSELILDKPPASKATEIYNRTWVILDELRQIGKIEGLGRFVTMGRDRGVCAVFGFQDYPGLIDSLGKEVAHELVSCCRHKLFLRLDNESAEWASKVLGKQEVTRQNITSQQGMGFGVSLGSSESFGGGNSQTRTTGWSSGSSSGPNGGSSSSSVFSSNSDTESSNWSYGNNKGANANISSSISVSHEVRERDVVLASQIANLPYFSEGRGIHGYTSDGGDGSALPTVYRIHVPIEECVAYMSKSSDEGFVAADPRKQDLFAELD